MTTLLVTVTPAEGQGEAMGRYLHGVQPLPAGAGGTPVKRVRVTDTITGTAGTGIALVMDFENAESIQSVFASDAYQTLIPDRDAGFSNVEILITEPLD
ncbi:DUF1330 domain-containing protein [Rhodoglobus aureus]|uniref:DUF1330 domain-containing protein n=1 Tax=Rhodoglobus aureus TaxID=191497 RepID=A0ABN1VSU0_9MICO